MPPGSCDWACRRGLRKEGGVPFRFFCPASTSVSFSVQVSKGTKTAMVWLDQNPLQLWTLQTSSLMELNDTQVLEVKNNNTQDVDIDSAEYILRQMGPPRNDFAIHRSADSPIFQVKAGEHTLLFQGRPETSEAFALQSIRFSLGGDICTFFLEGQDKLVEDC